MGFPNLNSTNISWSVLRMVDLTSLDASFNRISLVSVIAAWTDAIQSGEIEPIILVKPDGWVSPFIGSFYARIIFVNAGE